MTIRTHQRVLAVWNAGATTETPNTTENVDAPASGGSITWTQLVKLLTQPWEMHGMTTVCETMRTRIIQDALGSIHFSTRTLLVGGYDEPNYRSCGENLDIANAFASPAHGSLHQRIQHSYPWYDRQFHQQRLLEAIMEIEARDATFYVRCGSGNLGAWQFTDVFHLVIDQWHQRVRDPSFRLLIRFHSVLFRWICHHMQTMLTLFRFVPLPQPLPKVSIF